MKPRRDRFQEAELGRVHAFVPLKWNRLCRGGADGDEGREGQNQGDGVSAHQCTNAMRCHQMVLSYLVEIRGGPQRRDWKHTGDEPLPFRLPQFDGNDERRGIVLIAIHTVHERTQRHKAQGTVETLKR